MVYLLTEDFDEDVVEYVDDSWIENREAVEAVLRAAEGEL